MGASPSGRVRGVGNAESVLTGVQNVGHDAVDALAGLDLGEDEGSVAAHSQGVTFHDAQVRAYCGREIDLVDHQQIALGDAGAALAGDLVAAGNVDDLNGEVGEFPTEAGRQIIAARLDQEQVRTELRMQVFERKQVGGDVLPNRGMRASSGFDGADACRFERAMADQEFPVLAGEDIVGDGAQAEAITQGEAQLQHQRGLPTAHRAADPNREGPSREIAVQGLIPQMKMPGMIEVLVGMPVLMPMTVVMAMTVHRGVIVGVIRARGVGVRWRHFGGIGG